MSEAKDNLRQVMMEARLAMPKGQAEKASKLIIEKLFTELDWPKINSLHTYIPITRLNEINTWPLLTHAWQYPNVVTAIASARQSGKYMALKVGPATKWRGLYPASRLEMPKQQLYDVVIVPTLAFDKDGWRLGWGGGFYDRFLATQPKALKIGLAYQDSFVPDGIPHEAHDIKLDMVITEV